MDYIYGELNDLVKNINYDGKNTDTANTTVDNINRTIKVDVNLENVDYGTRWTETAMMNKDELAREYSVDVIKVPHALTFTSNTREPGEVPFDGSQSVEIDLRPIVWGNLDELDFKYANVKQLFRESDDGGIFYVIREGVPPVEVTVQNTVNNNSEISSNKVLGSLVPERNVDALFSGASATKLYSNKDYSITQSDGSTYDINAFRLGSSSSFGTLTLYLINPVSGIKINASKYATASGNYDGAARLFVNDIEVSIGNLFEEHIIEFDSPVSTLVFESRRNGSGSSNARVWIDTFSTLEGEDRYFSRELMAKGGDLEFTNEKIIFTTSPGEELWDSNWYITKDGAWFSDFDGGGSTFSTFDDNFYSPSFSNLGVYNFTAIDARIDTSITLNENAEFTILKDTEVPAMVIDKYGIHFDDGEHINHHLYFYNDDYVAPTFDDLGVSGTLKVENLQVNSGTGIGLFNQNTNNYDYIIPGLDGGDFDIPSTNDFGIAGHLHIKGNIVKSGGPDSPQYGLTVPNTYDWQADKLIAAETDLGNAAFTPVEGVTVNMQHTYQIGNIIFVHLNINVGGLGISSTGLYSVGTLNKHSAHEHTFPFASKNSGSGTATDCAILDTNGGIKARFTSTTGGSGYNHDLCFFFCEGQ